MSMRSDCFKVWLLAAVVVLGVLPAQAAPEQTSYLFGEVRTMSPAGQPYGAAISLVKRILRPDADQIVEIVLQLDDKRPVAEYTTIFTVKGSDFTLKESNGGFSGQGQLIGQPWAWTGWDYTVKMQGTSKGTLKGHDVFQGPELKVNKSYYSADGKLAALIEENYQPISAEMYATLHQKLIAGKPTLPCSD